MNTHSLPREKKEAITSTKPKVGRTFISSSLLCLLFLFLIIPTAHATSWDTLVSGYEVYLNETFTGSDGTFPDTMEYSSWRERTASPDITSNAMRITTGTSEKYVGANMTAGIRMADARAISFKVRSDGVGGSYRQLSAFLWGGPQTLNSTTLNLNFQNSNNYYITGGGTTTYQGAGSAQCAAFHTSANTWWEIGIWWNTTHYTLYCNGEEEFTTAKASDADPTNFYFSNQGTPSTATIDVDDYVIWGDNQSYSGDTDVNYTYPGHYIYSPDTGVTQILVKTWGAGGGGAGCANGVTGDAGGGAGGGYAESLVSVTPGNDYHVFVGAGGQRTWYSDYAGSGFDTYFGLGEVVAKGGLGGTPEDDGGTLIAALTTNTGDTTYTGGDGGAGGAGYGGGGGGAAGNESDGGDPSTYNAGSGGNYGGGDGGDGANGAGEGNHGTAPGGGAGGAYCTGSHTFGGNGAWGRMEILSMPDTSTPTVTLDLIDGYDGSNVGAGYTCYVGEQTNTTNAAGECYFGNNSLTNYSIPAQGIYIVKTGTATQNATTTVNLTRDDWVQFNLTSSYDGSVIANANLTMGALVNTSDAQGRVSLFNLLTYDYVITHTDFYTKVGTTAGDDIYNLTMIPALFYVDDILSPFDTDEGDNSITNIDLSITCGATSNHYSNASEATFGSIAGGENCMFIFNTTGWFEKTFNDTTDGGTANYYNFTPDYNAYYNFTGDITGTVYEPLCVHGVFGVLTHSGYPYYTINESGAITYSCFGGDAYNATSITTGAGRIDYQNFTLNEYKLQLDFSESVSGHDLFEGSSVYNWTNTTIIRTIDYYGDSFVKIFFDTENENPQEFHFYSEQGTIIDENLYVMSGRDTFAAWEILTPNSNPINDQKVSFYVANESASGQVLNWLKAGVQYTDDFGQVVFYFPSDALIKIEVDLDAYADVIKYYAAQDVENATRTSPIGITALTVDTDEVYNFVMDCYPDEVTNVTEIKCKAFTPVATSIIINTSTYGYSRTLHLPYINSEQEFDLIYCAYESQKTDGVCDFNQWEAFNMTVTVGGNTVTKEFPTYLATGGEAYYLANGTGFTLFSMPTVSQSVQRVIWLMMAVLIGALASVLIESENKSVGVHAFFGMMIIGAAVTSSFWWVLAAITAYYGLYILQSNWED